jgi:hypothetical protein
MAASHIQNELNMHLTQAKKKTAYERIYNIAGQQGKRDNVNM